MFAWSERKEVFAKWIGAIAALIAIWVAIGSPVPATPAMIDAKVKPIETSMVYLAMQNAEGQRDVIKLRLQMLRGEQYILTSNPTNGKPEVALQVNNRLSQIADELIEIEERDRKLRDLVERLKKASNNGVQTILGSKRN